AITGRRRRRSATFPYPREIVGEDAATLLRGAVEYPAVRTTIAFLPPFASPVRLRLRFVKSAPAALERRPVDPSRRITAIARLDHVRKGRQDDGREWGLRLRLRLHYKGRLGRGLRLRL